MIDSMSIAYFLIGQNHRYAIILRRFAYLNEHFEHTYLDNYILEPQLLIYLLLIVY